MLFAFEIVLGIPWEILIPAGISPALKLHVKSLPQKYDEIFSV